ncbi:L-seryl-tRNA(Sec) selenium transferase (plasmid) [Cytobacillus spongiae]|uniref:L-seryl-tRNA(Sec) selenium transferase n=1 Tax=Cytobacillus spongiae TaxID=2901381 RepID=UPI001F356056|nr:L-seryl-tRNA(Sec) selenium transferase [Cytobacillus spongiae]UII58352.1 L-seryl-tRNA(Sec) selenium transferase [Cytobacillus spongiae]
MNKLVRHIPPIHELQHTTHFQTFLSKHRLTKERGTDLIKKTVTNFRNSILDGQWAGPHPESPEFIVKLFTEADSLMHKSYSLSLRKVINASGTILHTNLGRAPLAGDVLEHVKDTAGHYSNLEYNIDEGTRGSRHVHAEKFICELTGAESAMVVNNNAAAVFLILSSLAKHKEVIVSRGELVEIGGSFRISSIMEESGAKLSEVGTTNKTHYRDFELAIGEETAMIMKVHQSNFVIKGFTASVSTDELVRLSRQHPQVIYYEDLGSGALFDFTQMGIGAEPLVKDVIKKGVDLVSFSGDKLLGGPQAGIIAGKKHWIEQLKKHQLARILRVDKMTLAALEMTLMHYITGDVLDKNPTIEAITRKKEDILQQSSLFSKEGRCLLPDFTFDIMEGKSQIGGGTMPDVELDTYLVSVTHNNMSARELQDKLRTGNPSIVTMIQENSVLFDLRTVSLKEQGQLLHALKNLH